MHIVKQFARHAVDYRTHTITPEVLHHAKRAVIDWYAALLPGAVLPPATLLEKAFAEELEHGRARLALGKPATTRLAALINGTASHTAEVDDIYREAIYHPGAPVIAAALAVAQAINASGESFLRAVIVGYEISTRIGAAMGRAHYKHWHNTGTIGCFGAAAAAAELQGLDERQFAHALATVATFASGLQQAFRMDSMSKPLHAGRAAEAGVTAALSAAQGVTGSLDVLEGEVGFGRAMGNGPDWTLALATLGKDFHITRMTFKNHACCGHTFAPIDGALALKAKLGIAASDIEEIQIATYSAALEVAGYEAPATPAEGRFSVKYTVATALTHGSVRLAAFLPERLNDPVTRALMQKIRLTIDPELDAAFPGKRAARITFRLRDGSSAQHLQPTRKGDPEAPLADDELNQKYLELATPVLGAEAAQALLEKLWKIESMHTLDALLVR
ncbi:MmgE/PrpD family protein [Noviherbaspirillum sp. Root189]|uniref:MmgE/PrpD family protein n=1 Tax=Noviherbaspirillum sp. Root189 TaxID=1736487 RepID=UPI000710DC87|nr:MmgE/PrpD family protein [Noviherbaspirillum sp. Root189]KRB93587.1 2-methylcitrate dehydratase [Noviherbaspirillum sp. Root189]